MSGAAESRSDKSSGGDAVKLITASRTVVVVGNPNAGKSTLFNRLTGLTQKVGNYPGVTVEKKEGNLRGADTPVRLFDIPGTYSLSAHSLDEIAAIDVILGQQEGVEPPDVIVHVVDASNLERNLYLFSQLQELECPLILALNMVDVATRRGLKVDAEQLATRLGVPVVVTDGRRGQGVTELRDAVLHACRETPVVRRWNESTVIPARLRDAVNSLEELFTTDAKTRLGREIHSFEALRAIVDENGHSSSRLCEQLGDGFRQALVETRRSASTGGPLVSDETSARHAWVSDRIKGCVEESGSERRHTSERIDAILTHRFLGLLIFAGVMIVLFQSIFTWAGPLMEKIDEGFGALSEMVGTHLSEGAFRSLLVDGVIGGVGGVLIFLPQILILFLFIGILEDCGYMSRAAFLMDRLMAKCGLSGKSFIPMLSSFACAIPGIMATRVIEDRRDRLVTILVTPLMTCSARLPVYAILIGTFIPDEALLGGFLGLQALTLFALYALGIVAAVAMAWLFKKTLLRGPASSFVLELPSYKLPSVQTVLLKLLERGVAFLRRAGTIILAISIIVWALAYFPRSAEIAEPFDQERERVAMLLGRVPPQDTNARQQLESQVEGELERIDREESGAYLRDSLLGQAGRFVEPVFRPLGWDWRISMATLASFPAREVIVATLGTIYNLGADEDEKSESLRTRLRNAKWDGTDQAVFTVPVALSVLVFFALCCQCGATVAMIRREANSWRWAWFAFGYMTVLAYVGAFVTFQVGELLLG